MPAPSKSSLRIGSIVTVRYGVRAAHDMRLALEARALGIPPDEIAPHHLWAPDTLDPAAVPPVLTIVDLYDRRFVRPDHVGIRAAGSNLVASVPLDAIESVR